jgi:hypothetical protein
MRVRGSRRKDESTYRHTIPRQGSITGPCVGHAARSMKIKWMIGMDRRNGKDVMQVFTPITPNKLMVCYKPEPTTLATSGLATGIRYVDQSITRDSVAEPSVDCSN